MEEYKRVCAIVRGKEYWAVGRSEVADAADAAIAELEAENEEWIGYFDACYTDMCHYKDRAEQAEAKLDALKADVWGPDERRCETCDHLIDNFNCYAAVSVFDDEDIDGPSPLPPDFCCNRWTHKR